MPYTPDVNDPTEPVANRPAGTAAEEFRAMKAALAALIIAASAAPSVRQAVQSAVLDANGYNNAITIGAGLRPGLTASADDPYHLSYAAGFVGGKPLNFDESIEANNADILGADLPTSNTSFLYRNYGVGFGSTLVPPQYGYAFDRTQGSLLNFEGANGAITTTDDFGNQWIFSSNARLDTAQFKFGTSSLLLDGTGDYVESTNFTSLGAGSWEIALWFRINALPGVGTSSQLLGAFSSTGWGAQLLLQNVAGATKLQLALSSNNSSNDIVNTTGANTTWNLNQWNKVRLVFDALGGTYKAYLSLNGAAETADVSVASSARICSINKIRIGSDNAGGQGFNGWIDAFRFLPCATKTTTETPAVVAPAITDYPVHFFSIPQMKMYEVTAPSTVANTNPVLTARTRLFLGEADTSAVAVTAVRNYAVRGEYISADTATPASGASTSFSHNIGTTMVTVMPYFKQTIDNSLGTTGLLFPVLANVSASNSPYIPWKVTSRNACKVQAGDQVNPWLVISSTGTATGLSANLKLSVMVKRAF